MMSVAVCRSMFKYKGCVCRHLPRAKGLLFSVSYHKCCLTYIKILRPTEISFFIELFNSVVQHKGSDWRSQTDAV